MAKSVKQSKMFTKILYILLIIGAYMLYRCMYPVREGVIFTNYDKNKLFTKPWGEFCMPGPPSCDRNLMEGPAVDGVPKIGCWCKGVGNAGNLDPPDPPCAGIDYNQFY
jgi:hypothetical protein